MISLSHGGFGTPPVKCIVLWMTRAQQHSTLQQAGLVNSVLCIISVDKNAHRQVKDWSILYCPLLHARFT